MDEEHKEKLRVARAAAREAKKFAVDAELLPEVSEVETLKAELAALKEKHRERAAHEHPTISGREKINDPGQIGGAQEEIKEALRDLIREQMQETFPERTPVRKTTRESVRPGAVVATDRDGNPIYRKRDQTSDPFHVPPELIDPGYEMQWIRISTHGMEDTNNQVNHFENGWRLVQADRPGWAGKFMPSGYRGHIFKDGLALAERPKVLSDEARQEALQKVRDQSRAQREQFGMALPPGFSGQTDSARAHTFARNSGQRESVPDGLRPTLDIDN